MKPTGLLKLFGTASFLAIACNMAAGAANVSRDWKKYPAVIELNTDEDVYAIGDAHGDPKRLAGVLLSAGLIPAAPRAPDQAKWAGGKSVLVVVGDMIDKGSESLEVIALLRSLQNDAASHGGQVIITMGNHEAEFLKEPLGNKTSEFVKELKEAGQNPGEVASCTGELGRFLCDMPIAVRVNDWFFSHGGNTKNRTIAELSAAIETDFAKVGFASDELVGKNSILEARLNKDGPGGLPWFQDRNPNADPQKLLAKYVKKLGVKHLVQGHQNEKVKFPDGKSRDEQTLFQRYGLLFLIDSGMSRGIDGSNSTGGVLRIEGGTKATVICANGTQKMLWDKKTDPDRQTQFCGKNP